MLARSSHFPSRCPSHYLSHPCHDPSGYPSHLPVVIRVVFRVVLAGGGVQRHDGGDPGAAGALHRHGAVCVCRSFTP